MEDINDYWKVLDYPPLFTTVDWNENQPSSTHNTFIPMEINQQKIAPPFQRRRSSSVDLPVNPFYSSRFNNNLTIQEEEKPIIKQEEIDALDLSTSTNNLHVVSNTSPSLSTCSSNNKDEHMTSTSSLKDHNMQQPQIKIQYPPSPPTSQQQKTLITSTYFPELPRTSFHDLGKQLRQHTKRRRSSSLPPAFHATNKHQQKPPAPIVFTQIQVTDPTPIQHTQKAAKVEVPPIAIERVPKKKAQQMNESTIPIDPILKQKNWTKN
ncbi:uncharacterized protein BX663DRAFT_175308 [Cokeromyces recurvatus]|uniref:uncharacterized protein n=1 Tax=Cokeromyces recurvatus TaxID=90255 RepID=UPI00221F0704|nr:uncharacterized protein BX663DRAFT_175308 [Cokeromyces recurvatus]KAI7899824.1 hypothetical protein BX663DRAFT_175308 [Cokeromyces recurvatus]